ncbi:MAG: hybrid sensor histidine kinase/response regulator [Rickettsiales bacterium]
MKILIVDDSFTTRKLIAGHLKDVESMEFEILEASNAKEALKIFEEQRPDLMLLDYLLQDANGMDVVNELRKNHAVIPVLMVTGFADVQLVIDAMHLGVQGYILKDRLSSDTLLWAIKNAEEKIRMKRLILEHRREIEEFSRTVSHNLRDKISSVNGLLEMAKEFKNGDPAKADEFIDVAHEAAKHAHAYLDKLFAYVAVTQQRPEKIMFPLEKMIAEVKEEMYAQFGGGDPRCRLSFDELPIVYGSYALIYTVFRNIFSNAAAYAGSSPSIRVEAEEDREHWVILVKDNGPGVCDAEKEKIFQVFERGFASRGIPGTGLGLAMCRRIVEEIHGGKIWAVPAAHGGCFCVALPKPKSDQ